MTAPDPVTLAVLNGRLVQIADEMDATLYRSAFNPIIAEAHDASHGLYHRATGATLVQGTSGLPVFVGSMAGAVKLAIDTIARTSSVRSDRSDSSAGNGGIARAQCSARSVSREPHAQPRLASSAAASPSCGGARSEPTSSSSASPSW